MRRFGRLEVLLGQGARWQSQGEGAAIDPAGGQSDLPRVGMEMGT